MFLSLETLTSIRKTGLPILVALMDLVNSYKFSISDDLTQMVNFPMPIPDCDSHSPALLDLFLSSDASICSTMAFPPLGNPNHVVNWDGLRDHLRDIPWEDIFKLGASATASEFCELVRVWIDVHIPHRKYQVKPHSSLWFSVSCAAAIVHRNGFFHLEG